MPDSSTTDALRAWEMAIREPPGEAPRLDAAPPPEASWLNGWADESSAYLQLDEDRHLES